MRKFLTEQTFTKAMREQVLPTLAACRTTSTFRGYDGVALHLVRYDAPTPRGTVLILHGLNESTEKYSELISYFLTDGLSVLIYDQRGFGKSPRQVPHGISHIDRFDEYLDDARCCMHGPLRQCPAPYYLFGHSMGGAVAALCAMDADHPFSKIVLSSPMIQTFRYRGLPPSLVRTLCRLIRALGGGKRKIWFLTEPDGNEPFESSSSLSPARYAAYGEVRRADQDYLGGAVTYSWVAEAMSVLRRATNRKAAGRIRVPLQLYSAENDALVENLAQHKFIRLLPKGQLITVKGSKHEIYYASDDILHPYLNSVLDFFKQP